MSHVPQIALNNGVEIPQLGFGVWQVSTQDIEPAVAKALEVGYRHIDTAAMYGNEAGVGRAMRASGVHRDEIFVTTKLNNDAHGSDAAQAAFDDSLDKLGLDHVDLYLIHWPMPDRNDYVETWQGLEKIYASGRARAIGVSNFQPSHLRRLVADTTVVPAVNQVEIHPTFAQEELRSLHTQLGIKTEAWSPLGQSRDLDNATVVSIAQRLGRTPAQVILRWHLQRGDVVFPKSVTPSRIVENFGVFDFNLDDSDVSQISALDTGKRIGPDPDRFN
ncbi:MAG: aldo/keto reductase [Nocardioidaceae bacterium]